VAERFFRKDHLFNADTVGQLAREYAQALPCFDADRFQREALAGFPSRELLARLDWIADCIEAQLSKGFPAMAEALEAAMPPPLDPTKTDDDFGQFIHAVPGILAVRHGLEEHRVRSLDLLYAATKRFSMEFYIRPFLNRWPDETLARLALWAEDENYHVRRLVSEGTRPKLPWAKAVAVTPAQTAPLLDTLHADPTRYVSRSVANHMNDLSKTHPDLVLDRLEAWRASARQRPGELEWMTRHALRTLVKQGHPGALAALGYRAEADVTTDLLIETPRITMGDALLFRCRIDAPRPTPVLVDYRIRFARPGGAAEKVFKLKQGEALPDTPFSARKRHKLKADASTFTLHPGTHVIVLQVNGIDRAEASFEIV
jgi:3-methyladenine DNA glycosylase AlkC